MRRNIFAPRVQHLLGPGHRTTGAARKKAITAVARHLAIALWRLFTGRATAAQH